MDVKYKQYIFDYICIKTNIYKTEQIFNEANLYYVYLREAASKRTMAGYIRFLLQRNNSSPCEIPYIQTKTHFPVTGMLCMYYGVLVKFVAACFVFLMKNIQTPNKGIFYLKLQKETNFCG